MNRVFQLMLMLTLVMTKSLAQPIPTFSPAREKINIDEAWTFALGNATNPEKDFNHAKAHFTYLAKAGYGDGPAAKDFDDRAWRKLNLPHDWCVELPFSEKGTTSHGSKAIGKNFPENSVGWYRKKIIIPATDNGKRISLEFDGVHRNSIVWVNGFYLGTELSGSSSFMYDISDYLVYGGENVIAVRADAFIEEGWYYEGAGIYRHVWLTKTNPLHVKRNGTFVTTELNDASASIKIRTTIVNETNYRQVYSIEEQVVGPSGNSIASGNQQNLLVASGQQQQTYSTHVVSNPQLWSLDYPFLHKVKTIVRVEGKIVDTYETTFGIRTVRFDANLGFFLNGKSIKIMGTNNHQDHSGVGTAMPDALNDYRIKQLKEMGSNAIRTSHNPPSPEFLDACDRLGMMVLDENRLMGSNPEHFKQMEAMLVRDRNHPSIILWSLGNEEWYIEGDARGARLASSMEVYAKRLDSSRAFTIASSGGWDNGIGTVTEVMGYNYLKHGDTDEHHKKFPWQPSIGTEESNTIRTRGIYTTDDKNCHLAPVNLYDGGAEGGWKYYSERPYLSGLFYWTGFDYRGEPTPYGWPAVTSQYGMMDLCGFPKDIYYCMQTWWKKDPIVHIANNWNKKGMEGKSIPILVFSNCESVELFLNGKSLGKKTMPLNSHLEWNVLYAPGVLSAKGFKNGKVIANAKIETTGVEAAIRLSEYNKILNADGKDIALVTVGVVDENGLQHPTAGNAITFSIKGPGKIIGVGNGNPSSHEPEQFHDTIVQVPIVGLKELSVTNLTNRPEVSMGVDDSKWVPAFSSKHKDWKVYVDTMLVVRGSFELPYFSNQTVIRLFSKSILENQSLYVNGHLIKSNIIRGDTSQSFLIDNTWLKPGKNEYAVTGKRFRKRTPWEEPNTDPGLLQLVSPAPTWERKVFNGLAQVIIQTEKQAGDIVLTASSPGLKSKTIVLKSTK